jgi:hypothetical protein
MPEGEDIGRLLAQAMGTLPPEPAAARQVPVEQPNSAPPQVQPVPKQVVAVKDITKDSVPMQHSETDAASQKDSREDENVPPARPRGHGGALPK